jgi:non-heme chloroperoxidase
MEGATMHESISRRHVLALAAASGLAVSASGARAAARQNAVTAKDGTKLFYQESGAGDPVVFVHGWSLNSDAWRAQFAGLGAAGLRCVAYDRRGHGRSDAPDGGYDYDTLSDDLTTLLDRLDLTRVTLVAHSMGSGEAVRYLTRGGKRVARVVLLAPTTPYLLQAADNPGLPMAALDKLRAALAADYAGYIRANARSGLLADTPQSVVDWAIGLSLQCSPKAAIALTHTYSETDFRQEITRVAVPTLILQGDADTLPVDLSGRRTAALIKGSVLKIYPGAPHGIFVTHAEGVNADVLAFARG